MKAECSLNLSCWTGCAFDVTDTPVLSPHLIVLNALLIWLTRIFANFYWILFWWQHWIYWWWITISLSTVLLLDAPDLTDGCVFLHRYILYWPFALFTPVLRTPSILTDRELHWHIHAYLILALEVFCEYFLNAPLNFIHRGFSLTCIECILNLT